MSRYAVVGASQGTGLHIVQQLAAAGQAVRAIARTPPPAGPLVEPFAADVTDKASIARALEGSFDAVFFTVDITGGIGGHALFGSRSAIREVTYQGCLNAMAGAAQNRPAPRFVLLSVIGSDQSSLVWTMLNTIKPGSKRNILDREAALRRSGLPYQILRAPKLNDGPGGAAPVAATEARHRLVSSMGIPRADLAGVMIAAARSGPANTVWDVFSDPKGPVPGWLKAA